MTINASSGLLTWTPAANQTGAQNVTVQVSDGHAGGTATQSFTMQVNGVQQSAHAPVALGNSYAIRADQTLTVPAPGVLGNDSDADQDPLTAVKLSDPAKGTLAFTSTGAFSFTPTPAALVCLGTPTPTGVSFPQPLLTPLVSQDNGHGAIGLAKGDFNHDGAIDLAVTMSDNPLGFRLDGFVKVMLGNGDGSFRTPVTLHTLPGEPFVGGLRAKDFDGDGELDLVTVTSPNPQVLFFKGRGDGTFAAPVASPGAQQNIPAARDVHGADVNGDGVLDVITLSFHESAIAVQIGNGAGTFAAPVAYDVPGNPIDFAVGDVNGDRALDVVVGLYNARRVDVFLNRNDGSGGLLPARSSDPLLSITTGLYLADFNSDGKLDLSVSGAALVFPNGYGGGAIGFIAGNGDGTFAPPAVANFVRVESDPERHYTENVAPDLNNDGKPDVMFTSFGGQTNFVYVGLNNGDGTFTVTHWVASRGPVAQPGGSVPVDLIDGQGMVAGDFNGDGVPDIAASGVGSGLRPGGVSLLLGVTQGTFSAPRSSLVDFIAEGDLAVGDFTNDGVPEAAFVSGNDVNAITLVPVAADGTLGPAVNALTRISGPGEFISTVTRTADFDRDGNLDLVYLGRGGAQGGPPPRIIVAYGDGTGHFRRSFFL
jgi:hypothetical protein